MTANGTGFLWVMMKMFRNERVMLSAPLSERIKNPWIACFNRMSLMVCELFFDKAVILKRSLTQGSLFISYSCYYYQGVLASFIVA